MSSSIPSEAVIDSFDYGSVTVDQIEDSLKRNGGCFIRNFMSTTDADTLATQMRPFLEADKPWEGEFFPKETRSELYKDVYNENLN